jgi:hypothetical protein
VHSNRGKQSSDREVEKLLSVIEIQTFNTIDEQEVAGYAAVMETLFERMHLDLDNAKHMLKIMWPENTR